MARTQYQLELYEPGSDTTPVGCWPTNAPLPIAVGDVLRIGVIDPEAMPSAAVRVVRVEHALRPGPDGVLQHKLMLFTAPASATSA